MLRPAELHRVLARTSTAPRSPPTRSEFLLAMLAYQKRFRRRYPTWREVLHVARCLGYRKVAEPIERYRPPLAEANTREPDASQRESNRELRLLPLNRFRISVVRVSDLLRRRSPMSLLTRLLKALQPAAAEAAAAASRRPVRPAVPRRRLVARRPRRATPQLPLVGVRRGQRHRPGSRPAPAVPVPQHRPGRARADRRCRTRTRSAGCSTTRTRGSRRGNSGTSRSSTSNSPATASGTSRRNRSATRGSARPAKSGSSRRRGCASIPDRTRVREGVPGRGSGRADRDVRPGRSHSPEVPEPARPALRPVAAASERPDGRCQHRTAEVAVPDVSRRSRGPASCCKPSRR